MSNFSSAAPIFKSEDFRFDDGEGGTAVAHFEVVRTNLGRRDGMGPDAPPAEPWFWVFQQDHDAAGVVWDSTPCRWFVNKRLAEDWIAAEILKMA